MNACNNYMQVHRNAKKYVGPVWAVQFFQNIKL